MYGKFVWIICLYCRVDCNYTAHGVLFGLLFYQRLQRVGVIVLCKWCEHRHSGVAGPLAAQGGGQICRPFVLGF